jgi:predicted ABC-type ATPase
MPLLHLLGGANGSGKTTWYQLGLQRQNISPDLPFINLDMIVSHELGEYTPENLAKAEGIARDRMRDLLQNKHDFMIESNLSKSSDYDWIDRMRKNGYDTNLFFLGTKNVEINKVRVRGRVLDGGHDVADPVIEQRYRMGLTYLKSKILDFTVATLIDVSENEPQIMAKLNLGQVSFKHPSCPTWVQSCIDLAERLEEKMKRITKLIDPNSGNSRGKRL